MEYLGYYEIINYKANQMGLKASVITGNVEFNRLHWHDSLEIFCCIYGNVSVNIQGIAYNLKEGDLITINRNLSHEISGGTPQGLQLIFSVDESLLKGAEGERYIFSTIGNRNLPRNHEDICIVRSSIAKLACMLMPSPETMTKVTDSWGEDKTDPHLQKYINVLDTEEKWYQFHMEVYRILMCLAKHKESAQSSDSSAGPDGHLIRCIEKIHLDYGQPLNVKILAEEIGFSEATIYRLFKKHLGVSPNHYLNSVRISASCGLIENTDCNMTEIASQCGFSTLSNFYRAFHQFLGMSPREYRKYRGLPHSSSRYIQKDLMRLNRFQLFWELPYTLEDLEQIADSVEDLEQIADSVFIYAEATSGLSGSPQK